MLTSNGRLCMDTECKRQQKPGLRIQARSVCRKLHLSDKQRVKFVQQHRRAYPPGVSEPTSRTFEQNSLAA